MKPKLLRRLAVLEELHSLQQPQRRCAELMGMTAPSVSVLARALGLKFSKTWMNRHPKGVLNKERAEGMVALYRAGYTLEQIGAQHGITRERVRQILKKHKGINRFDGGQSVVAERGRAARKQAKDARQLAKHGCTYEEWQHLRKVGEDMLAQGRGLYQTPLRAYSNQRNNALRRGIGWELSLWQWWCIWQSSGHWEERGRGDGYVMCRKGDDGPYAADNVFIGTAAQNSYEGQLKYHQLPGDLPMGVRRTATGRYVALRRKRHLGTYDTPQEAHAAYLLNAPTTARITRRKHGLPSGVKRSRGRFSAYFYQGKKQVYIGIFATIDEAVAARSAALTPQSVAA